MRAAISRPLEVLLVALRLGLTSFGGPVAHLGYFRQEYVATRKWLDERTYADLVALCQFLPGPTSSQVGIAVGISRCGLAGGVAAWLGFTAPSAALLILFAYGVGEYGDLVSADWLRGLKIVALAVVALAVWEMAKNLAPDRTRATIAVATAAALLAWQNPAGYVILIAAAGVAGWLLLRGSAATADAEPSRAGLNRYLAFGSLGMFFILLVGLPLSVQLWDNDWLSVFDGFYRSGSMIFGGGHVVLPLLQSEVVTPGWVTSEEFVAGYGVAQAIPGPLLTFSAYLGTAMGEPLGGWTFGLFALSAIFLPSFLLLIGVLPFWDGLRKNASFRAALTGVNAAVVGLLAAALYDPVWTTAIHSPVDLAIGLASFGLLAFWRWPPWLVVPLTALAAGLVSVL